MGMSNHDITSLYDRLASEYDGDRGRTLDGVSLALHGFTVQAYEPDDAGCGGHTVWLATF